MEDNMPTDTDEVRVSIRLSPQAKEAVDEIQRLGDYKSMQEAIRRAISDELFLLQQKNAGWTVLLRKGNDYRELVWS